MATLVCVFPFLYNIGQVPKRTEDINISLCDHQFALEIIGAFGAIWLLKLFPATCSQSSADTARTQIDQAWVCACEHTVVCVCVGGGGVDYKGIISFCFTTFSIVFNL